MPRHSARHFRHAVRIDLGQLLGKLQYIRELIGIKLHLTLGKSDPGKFGNFLYDFAIELHRRVKG